MTTINVDISAEAGLYEILDLIEGNSGRIVSHQAIGPAGGNPNLTIEFPDDQSAISFLVPAFIALGAENTDFELFKV